MKALLTTVLLLLCAAQRPAAAQSARHVTLEAQHLPAMKAGAAQDLKIFFHPKKGIHINLHPALQIAIGKNSAAASVGAIHTVKDANGYLNPAHPVTVHITASPDLPKGKQMVKLTVVYYLCSDAEGWCNRDQQTLDVPVTVK